MRQAVIYLEGADGCGKTSVLNKILLFLKRKKVPIDSIIQWDTSLAESPLKIEDPVERFLTVLISRRRAEREIRDKMAGGKAILSDRGPLSTAVYQHLLDKIPVKQVDSLSQYICKDLPASRRYHLIFQCSPQTLWSRLEKRDGPLRGDKKTLAAKIGNVYNSWGSEAGMQKFHYPFLANDFFIPINADSSLEEVVKDTLIEVYRILNISYEN